MTETEFKIIIGIIYILLFLYFSYKTLFIYIVIDSLFTRIYNSYLRHVYWKCRKMFTIKCCYFLVIRVGCSFVSDWLLAIECCRYLFLKLFSAFRKPSYVSLIFFLHITLYRALILFHR